MSKAKGEVIETPTQDMPFKAIISYDGSRLFERYFFARSDAEIFVVEMLSGMRGGEPVALRR
jgi:hypothetical protein